MNLYLLKQVNFPLTNAQLTSFFTEHDYTTYFTLQQALNELEDAGLIHKEASHSSTRYDITKEGEETLNFFGKNISPAIISDMDEYLKENKFRLREEVGTTADFYKGTNQDYIVHCEVRENKAVLIGLDLSVPDKEQAEAVCGAWRLSLIHILQNHSSLIKGDDRSHSKAPGRNKYGFPALRYKRDVLLSPFCKAINS